MLYRSGEYEVGEDEMGIKKHGEFIWEMLRTQKVVRHRGGWMGIK